jgi:hypothetical protein
MLLSQSGDVTDDRRMIGKNSAGERSNFNRKRRFQRLDSLNCGARLLIFLCISTMGFHTNMQM